MAQQNVDYYDACRDPSSRNATIALYKNLQNYQLCPVSALHQAVRDNYERYPARMVTHAKDELFIRCMDCNRAYCTDAWRPYGYDTVYSVVRLVGVKQYRCWDTTTCQKLAALNKPV